MSITAIALAKDTWPGDGPPAVFLHGMMGDRSLMQNLAEWWWGKGRAALTLDLPGHGLSPTPAAPISVANSAELVHSAVQQAGFKRPIIIAHSMGALVAIETAVQNPDFFGGLVLLDPAPIIMDENTKAQWNGLLGMLEGEQFDEAKDMLVGAQSGSNDDPERVKARAEVFARIERSVLTQSFASMIEWNGASVIARCSTPIAAIWGGRNQEPDQLLDAKPDVIVGQVLGAGHYIHIEAESQVQAMIERISELWGS